MSEKSSTDDRSIITYLLGHVECIVKDNKVKESWKESCCKGRHARITFMVSKIPNPRFETAIGNILDIPDWMRDFRLIASDGVLG